MHEIRPTPRPIVCTNAAKRNVVTCCMPNLSKFKQLVPPKFMLPIKFILTDKLFQQFLCLNNWLLLKFEKPSCVKTLSLKCSKNVSLTKINLWVFPEKIMFISSMVDFSSEKWSYIFTKRHHAKFALYFLSFFLSKKMQNLCLSW